MAAQATEQSIDQARSEAFAGRMLDVLNSAALALSASIGHQVGLFDTLHGMPPASSEEIARRAQLSERYVREWLGAMVTAQVVEHDPVTRRYWLPPEHAAWLTRAAGPNNLAVQTQYIPLLAEVEQKIVECFRGGGGVPYSEYPRFQQLQAEDSATVHDAALVNSIIPLVPGLPERLRAGIDVADIGCGSGHAINLLAKEFPNSRFSGFDFSEQGIASARAEAASLGLSNASFEVRDVTRLGIERGFDLITAFDTIHDQARPAEVLRGIAAALRDDGVFLMVDVAASSHVHENVAHPLGTFLYTVSTMHCMTVSLALDGEGLGAMWGEEKAKQMLADAGFSNVEVTRVEGDIINVYYVARKGA